MERRKLLALLGGSASLGLAGCLGGGGDDDGEDNGGDGGNGGDDNGGDGGNGGDDNGGDGGNGDDNGEPSEANLAISVTSSTDTVAPGESATVEWEVENTGGMEGSGTVVFSVGGSQEDSQDVTVGGGETATGEFSYTAAEGDSGDLALTVAIDGDEASATVTIPEAASFAVDISAVGPIRVEPGTEATVPWQVENTGGLEGTQAIVFSVEGSQEGSQEVTLGGGETTDGEFTYVTEEGGEEAIEVTVASDDETASVNIAFGVNVASSFSATAENARAAIDNDPSEYTGTEGEPYQEIDTGEPLVELSGDIFDDGNWGSTSFSVPDLVDILLALDLEELASGLLEDFDIQADIVEAFTLDELLVEIGGIIYGFNFSQEQATAASDLFGVLAEEFELPAPSLLPGIIESVLVNPELRDDYGGGDPAQVIANDLRDLLDTLGSFLDSVPEIETTEDLLAALTTFIDEIPDGQIDQLLPFIAETIGGLNLEDLLGDFSIDAQPAPVGGTFQGGGDSELLMTVPLNTVTLVPDLGEDIPDPPEVDLDLGLELTTGASGNLEGEFSPDAANDTAAATVVDNEFTADLTEFDLAGLVEGLDQTTVLVEVFTLLEINLAERIPDSYDGVGALVEQLDLVALIEDGEPLGIVEGRLLRDESGRHAVVADLGLEFEDLNAVLEA
jgi:hypothetical protein